MTLSQAHSNLTGFPEMYSNGYLILKFFSSYFLCYQLFETIQNAENTLIILMGLKGGDCVRKAEVNNKKHMRIRWEQFMQIGKPVKFQRACMRVWDRVSV